MARAKIQNKCYKCGGEGIHYKDTPGGVVEIDPCPICLGEKYLTVHYLLLDKFAIAFAQINEKLDALLEQKGTD